MTTTTTPLEPTDPKRVRSFAIFFKNYMSISTLIVAALPVPVTSMGLIPTFAVQTKLLSVYTSLFCFLLLGYIFYSRHTLARRMFPQFVNRTGAQPATGDSHVLQRLFRRAQISFLNALPLLFIASSLVLAFQYNDVLKSEVNRVRRYSEAVRQYGDRLVSKNPDDGSPIVSNEIFAKRPEPQPYTEDQYPITLKGILANTDLNDITYGSRLMILYVGIFLTAEAAFILMAIKEYLQDLAGLTERDLLDLRHPVASAQSADS